MTTKRGKYQVIIYNDDKHTYQEVSMLLTSVCNLSYYQAIQCVNIIDNNGSYAVFEESYTKCMYIWEMLTKAGLQCLVRKKSKKK